MNSTKRIITRVAEFAIAAHGDQLYGRRPYECHLLDVINVLRRFHDWDELTQDLIDAAWLHDVIEDTNTRIHLPSGAKWRLAFDTADETSHEIEVNGDVVHLVQAVTNVRDPSIEKEEAKRRTYANIRSRSGAIVLKLADRIANVEQSVSRDRLGRRPGKFFARYLKEWPQFESELRGRSRGEGASAILMWSHLESLFNTHKDDLAEEA
jgi:(p)ppGpp synthase/HD superfamily hydrolase